MNPIKEKMLVWAGLLLALAGGCSDMAKVNPILPSLTSSSKIVWRVACNSGSNQTDSAGHVWLKDKAYVVGGGYGNDNSFGWAGGFSLPVPYNNQRHGFTREYYFEVVPGLYQVTLKEYDGDSTVPGTVVFNIEIPKGSPFMQNVDIFSLSGSTASVRKTYDIVTNIYTTQSLLTIYFSYVKTCYIINGIEVQQL